MKLPMLSADDKLAEIRRLYFKTTRQTIQQDLEKALDLLKSMATRGRARARDGLHGRAGADAEGLEPGKAEKPERAQDRSELRQQAAALLLARLIGDDLLARRDPQRLRHVAIDRQLGEILGRSAGSSDCIDSASGVFGFLVSARITP